MIKHGKIRTDTLITQLGRDPEAFSGAFNTQGVHASTIVHQRLAAVT